ncbi:MAG: hypothetical protein AABW89_05925 [Nanoarchaeota archaeon]
MEIGLLMNFIGFLIMFGATFFGSWYNKDLSKKWYECYYWSGWRPFLRITNPETGEVKWKVKWKYVRSVEGAIPPKYMWDIIGALYVVVGFLLQFRKI